jgi:hypothetical protein
VRQEKDKTHAAVIARYCGRPAKSERVSRAEVRKESVGRTSVPDLGFYPLIIHRDYASGKLDTNRRSALSIEFVAYEPREHYDYEMSAAVMSCSPNSAYVQLLCGWKRVGKKNF